MGGGGGGGGDPSSRPWDKGGTPSTQKSTQFGLKIRRGPSPFLDPLLVRNSIGGGSLHLSLLLFCLLILITEIFSIRMSVAIENRKRVVSAFRFPLRPQSPRNAWYQSHFLSFAFNLSLRNDGWFTYKTCATSLKEFEKKIILFVNQSYCQTHLYWRGINHDL